jgi:hypothetical protein
MARPCRQIVIYEHHGTDSQTGRQAIVRMPFARFHFAGFLGLHRFFGWIWKPRMNWDQPDCPESPPAVRLLGETN